MKIHFAAQRIYDDLDYSGEEWLATPIRYQWFDFETERYYEISRDHRGDWELTTWLRSQRIYDANPYCRRLVRCCGGGRSQLRGGCSSVWRGSAAWLS